MSNKGGTAGIRRGEEAHGQAGVLPERKGNGLNIFYREAGPKGRPTLLLLHGLPSSSRMFQPLLTRLSGKFHLVAPDYPGFGHSDWPDPKVFRYTFDNIAQVMCAFTPTQKGKTIWLKPVSDEQYNSAK